MIKTDVIIVGAGPTGLALAGQLRRYGVEFVIFDQKDGTTPFSKAIGVQARTLEIYEQIGLADKLVAAGAIAEKASFVEGGAIRGTAELAKIGEGLSPYPFLLIVEQGLHEKILDEHLRAEGKEVLWQTTLESFSQTEAGVTAAIRTADGATETIEAKFLVGCDGAKSAVRHGLGLGFAGSTLDRLFYVADAAVDWNFAHDSLYVCLAQNTITAFFPMVGENRFRIVGTFPEGHQADEGEILYEEIEARIKKDVELDLNIHDVKWFSVYRVHSRRVDKFANGRCFVAGDAAHIHTPAGAQGMNTGIQDGYNLAWKLAAVLRGKASLSLLETYDEERSANAKRLLQTTDRAFDFGASDEWFVAFFRTKIFPHIAGFALHFDAVKKLIFPLVSQIGINYRKSSLSAENGFFKVRAGDRMPWFETDGASVYERLKAPKFHLLNFFDGTNRPAAAPENELLDVFEIPLYPALAEIFGASRSFSVLLRPDNYIGLITEDLTGADVAKYLARF
ncbi:MAG: FAD-dependent monooxygenase [Acidobacteria bacterium]|nr:FAD-dependent monooxygenase [Acidobacteriota bacterium]